MTDEQDLAALARAPAWPLADMLALPGRVKGGLLKEWGEHVRRRFGAAEPDALRAALGVGAAELPDAPDEKRWYPVGWQLALSRLIADRHLGGDILRLEALIREDARRKQDRLVDKIVRLAIAPRRFIAASDKVHAALYDLGRAEAHVERHRAVVRWSGVPCSAEPTWRVIQLFAVRGLFDTLHAPEPRCVGRAISRDAFELVIEY